MPASIRYEVRAATTGISRFSRASNLARSGRLELRAEGFNVWNHTEFDQVSNGLGSSNFGQVTSAFDPRVFQVGAKLYF